jgi:hypothetical protein
MTLTGENDVARQADLRRLVASFVAEHTDMGLGETGRRRGFLTNAWSRAVQSLPFLASRKLVVLRAPSKNKEFYRAL